MEASCRSPPIKAAGFGLAAHREFTLPPGDHPEGVDHRSGDLDFVCAGGTMPNVGFIGLNLVGGHSFHEIVFGGAFGVVMKGNSLGHKRF